MARILLNREKASLGLTRTATLTLPLTNAVREGWRLWCESTKDDDSVEYRNRLLRAKALGGGQIIQP